MNPTHSARVLRTFSVLPVLLAAILFFLFPKTVFHSLLQGFETAFCRVIPAVFPMMVVSGIVLESPLAAWLGLLFLPYLHRNYILLR